MLDVLNLNTKEEHQDISKEETNKETPDQECKGAGPSTKRALVIHCTRRLYS